MYGEHGYRRQERHVRRAIGVAMATIALAGLTGCTGSAGSSGPTGGSSFGSETSAIHGTTRVVPELTQGQIWDRSVCSRLDPQRVAEASATGVVGWTIRATKARKQVTSTVGAPTFDYCRIATRAEPRADSRRTRGTSTKDEGFGVYVGVSASVWSDTRWKEYRSAALHSRLPASRYSGGELEHAGGREVLVQRGLPVTRALVLVDDRVLSVQVRGPVSGTTQLLAVLRQVLPQLKALPASPVTARSAACEKADVRAESALGGSAVVRRDSGSGDELTCGWATHDAFVHVHARGGVDFAPALRHAASGMGASPVHGVGDAAVYTAGKNGTPPTVRVASNRHLIFVEGSGGKVSKATLTAVAAELLGNY